VNDRRHTDDALVPGAVSRVVTMKQLVAILSFVLLVVTLLQTLGLKFVADSYIDQRIRIHSVDPKAHEGAIAMAVADADRLHGQLEGLRRDVGEATKAINATNERLARIEGALAVRAR
jgi:hypothetical protein